MTPVLLVVIAAAVAGWVLAPLRRSASAGGPHPQSGADRERANAALEAARSSLRDLELDYATGKVNADDYRALRVRFTARAADAARGLDVDPTSEDLHAGPPAGGRTV